MSRNNKKFNQAVGTQRSNSEYICGRTFLGLTSPKKTSSENIDVKQHCFVGAEMMSSEYLTAGQVARRYGVTDQTIRRLVADRKFPTAIAIGRQLRWRVVDLDRWDEAQARAGVTK